MVEAAQRLQAASHAAMAVYDGLTGPADHMGTMGHGVWVCRPCYLEVPG